MKTLRASWRALRLAEHLLTGAALTLIHHRAPKPGKPERRRPDIVSWWHGRLCRILGIQIDARGAPALTGGLLVANHVSWLDVPVLGALCPTVFLSKSEVRHWPVIGWLGASAGTLFIARGAGQVHKVSDSIARKLCARSLITLFPEGTTSEGSGVLRFHPRLFAPALDTSCRVQPVALRYVAEGTLDKVAPFVGTESFASHLWRVLSQPGFRVEVSFCEPLAPPYTGRRELAEAARQRIIDVVNSPLDRDETTPQEGCVPVLGASHG